MRSLRVVALDGGRHAAAVREQWRLTPAENEAMYAAARAAGVGLVQLATCYRTEFYVDGDTAFLYDAFAVLRPHADVSVLSERPAERALRHLVRVAAGLESAVLGEVQVLGQLKAAWRAAQGARTQTSLLRLAFTHALRIGRTVRTQTSIGQGVASVASAAVLLAQRAPMAVRDRHVVVVGAGEMGQLLLKHLPGVHPARITLVTRTGASSVADVAPPEALPDLLGEADVVFTATDRAVFGAAALVTRHGRPLTIIDVGMPRNVDVGVDAIAGVTRYDIDAVGLVVDGGLRARVAAIPEAERLVDEGLAALHAALDAEDHEEVVRDLRRKAERIRVESVAHICGSCTDRTCAPVAEGGEGRCSDPDAFSRTLTTRLLHDLTRALRQHADLDPDTLRRLLGLAHA